MRKAGVLAALVVLTMAGAVRAEPETVMAQERSDAIVSYLNDNEGCTPSKRNPSQCMPVSDARQILFGPVGTAKTNPRGGARASTASPGPVNLGVNFLLGSASLTETSRRSLDRLAASFIKAGKATTAFFVDGHTDRTGSCDLNLSLSQARANAAVEYLAAKGVDRSRMQARGFGYEKLKDSSDPNAAANRRVEVIPRKLADSAREPSC